ncbi:MAG: murein biosynthesis integral membrane protein MurJ [Carboxydocellales bacterium]
MNTDEKAIPATIEQNRGIAKAAGVIMIAMLLSRVLGFVREQAMTTQFGRTYITDAYFAAFSIPDLLYNLLVGGALSSAFIPVFSGYLAKGKEEEAWDVASTVINIAVMALFLGIILGEIFTPFLIPIVASKFQGESLDLTIKLSRIMLPAVLFTGLNGIMMGILNSYKDFTYPVIGAVIYNVGIIAMGVLLGPYIGIAGFSVGVIVGVIGNFLIQFPSLIRMKKMKYRPVLNLKHPGVKRIFLLMIPAIIGLSVSQVNLLINQNLASGLASGSITALRMANRLMILPVGVFAYAISTAVFPTLTAQAATDRMQEYKQTFSLGIRSIIFITIPASVGLMTLGVPIVRLLFEQGKFLPEDTLATAAVLFYYSIGLFAQSAVFVIVRGFYAIQDTTTPLKIGLLTIAANYILNHLFIRYLEARGLALAYSLTGFLDMIALLYLLRRKIGPIGMRKVINSVLKILVAASAMGVCAYFMAYYWEVFIPVNQKILQLAEIGIIISVAVGIYLVIARMFKMEELDMVLGVFLKKFKRKRALSTE